MSTFEYKVVKEQRYLEAFPARMVDWGPAATLLKNMAEDGWELVSVTAYPELGTGPRGGVNADKRDSLRFEQTFH